MLGQFFIQIIGSFLATVSFAIVTNVPKRALIFCGLTGSSGWTTYWLVNTILKENAVLATFCGAVAVAILTFLFSKFLKLPVTVFNIPGIFPLVPGIMAYQTIKSLVLGQYMDAIGFLVKTFSLSFAIASALIVTELLNQSIRRFREK